MHSFKTPYRVLGALSLGLLLQAADPELDALKAQMRELTERIAAQEKSLAELKTLQAGLFRKLDKTAAPAPAPAPAPALIQAESAPAATGRTWFTGRVRLGGYGSMRYEASNLPGSANGFTFRRFVMSSDAQITSRLRTHTELEFERFWGIEVEKQALRTDGGLQLKQEVEGNHHGEIALEQAWTQYNFAENHGLRAGVVLVPLGRFNLLHDDDYWELPRRTLVDRDGPATPVKTAWRDLGAGLVGSFSAGARKIDYQLYVLNGAGIDFNLESVAQTRFPRRSKLELLSLIHI